MAQFPASFHRDPLGAAGLHLMQDRETFKQFFERTKGLPYEGVPGTPISIHMEKIAEATAEWNDMLAAEQTKVLSRIERAVFPLG